MRRDLTAGVAGLVSPLARSESGRPRPRSRTLVPKPLIPRERTQSAFSRWTLVVAVLGTSAVIALAATPLLRHTSFQAAPQSQEKCFESFRPCAW